MGPFAHSQQRASAHAEHPVISFRTGIIDACSQTVSRIADMSFEEAVDGCRAAIQETVRHSRFKDGDICMLDTFSSAVLERSYEELANFKAAENRVFRSAEFLGLQRDLSTGFRTPVDDGWRFGKGLPKDDACDLDEKIDILSFMGSYALGRAIEHGQTDGIITYFANVAEMVKDPDFGRNFRNDDVIGFHEVRRSVALLIAGARHTSQHMPHYSEDPNRAASVVKILALEKQSKIIDVIAEKIAPSL